MLTWCLYDITNDKRRRNIIRLLEEYGFLRVQYSVFLGDVNVIIKLNLFQKIKKELKEKEDSLYLFSISKNDFKNLKIIGKGIKKESFLEERNVLIF